ncbi:MAG: tRNA glutamyl-Q(34) synthetase GluQRS [Pseudomonadota bacterium]
MSSGGSDRVERFAPSPTGLLHLGHAFSALIAWEAARAAGGTFLLRIEDIDRSRARPHWETQIFDDLAWLGLSWAMPVLRQSARMEAYSKALDDLWACGVLYPCTCRRRDIEAALSAPQEGAVPHGPDGPVYPGTCRERVRPEARPLTGALRLDMRRAVEGLADLWWRDTGTTPGVHLIDKTTLIETVGDVALARRDLGTSYHLAVVLDDADQGVTHVTRGEDLFQATQIHVVLQRLLALPTPIYHHHRLIRDGAGKRLAKRDDARAIARYRAEGASPADIRRWVGL